jgi:hypothetical protein
MRLVVTITLLLLLPALAEACPSCVSSAFGDRTFNWAFAILLGTPFVVGGAIGGVLLWLFRRHRDRPTLPIEETT